MCIPLVLKISWCTRVARCKERGDKWASEVEQRLLACIDLVAAEAVYVILGSCLIKISPRKV